MGLQLDDFQSEGPFSASRGTVISSLVFLAMFAKFVAMNFAIETDQETDGRWIAEIPQIPGALAYGVDRREAISKVEALALRVLADRIEHGEMPQELEEVFSITA